VGRISQGVIADKGLGMKVIFFGLGSIGERHARLLKEIAQHDLYAFRRKKSEPSSLGLKEVFDWTELEAIRPEVAFITNPTSMHIETAIQCANHGMHLFMEKPLSNSREGIDELEEVIRAKKITFYTAYCLRFHPVIKKVRELIQNKDIYHVRAVCASYLPGWRPGQDHRKNYSSIARLGGGVLLDLSHELDYVQYLFGSITAIDGKIGRCTEITVDVEDFADLVMTAGNGLPVTVHLDYFSHKSERTLQIDFKDGFIAADLLQGFLTYSFEGKSEEFKFASDRDEFFKEQLKYFFDNIGNSKIMNNFAETRALFETMMDFKDGQTQNIADDRRPGRI
jgi:predicted dehydrogenase